MVEISRESWLTDMRFVLANNEGSKVQYRTSLPGGLQSERSPGAVAHVPVMSPRSQGNLMLGLHDPGNVAKDNRLMLPFAKMHLLEEISILPCPKPSQHVDSDKHAMPPARFRGSSTDDWPGGSRPAAVAFLTFVFVGNEMLGSDRLGKVANIELVALPVIVEQRGTWPGRGPGFGSRCRQE